MDKADEVKWDMLNEWDRTKAPSTPPGCMTEVECQHRVEPHAQTQLKSWVASANQTAALSDSKLRCLCVSGWQYRGGGGHWRPDST
jgi:hypothetical protein